MILRKKLLAVSGKLTLQKDRDIVTIEIIRSFKV